MKSTSKIQTSARRRDLFKLVICTMRYHTLEGQDVGDKTATSGHSSVTVKFDALRQNLTQP